MVRKKAIKRLIWKSIIFVVSWILFGTIWAPAIILYLIQAVNMSREIHDEESIAKMEEIKSSMTVRGAVVTDLFGALFTIALPLIPAIVISVALPEYSWAGGVIGFITLLHLVVKPIFFDLIRVFTNNEKHIDITKKVVTIATVAIIALTVIQVGLNLLFPKLFEVKYDHKALWNEYVTEQNLGEEFRSYIGEEEPVYLANTGKTKSRIRNVFQTGIKNGLIQEATFILEFALDKDAKEWSVASYSLQEENTYELANDTTWTGSNGGNYYTITMFKGYLYDTKGHLTIKDKNGKVTLDSDFVCSRASEDGNEYIFTTDAELSWWSHDIRMIYNEEDGSFTFDNQFEGTIYLQN